MNYVISDLHGMYQKYLDMLEEIDFKETDTLYVLGDIVDRGKESMKILKDLMARSNVVCLFGNHELMMMDCMDFILQEITTESINNIDEEIMGKLEAWMNNGGYQTIQELHTLGKDEKKDIIDFLMEFEAYEEVEVNDKQFTLVHAGLGDVNEEKTLDEFDINDLIWRSPDWEIPFYNDPNKFVVVGHTPTLGITGQAKIFHKNNYIAIDCGACFSGGQLACLCLDTMEEFYV